MLKHLRDWYGREGVFYIGKAREGTRVLRTERCTDPQTGRSERSQGSGTAMVNLLSLRHRR